MLSPVQDSTRNELRRLLLFGAAVLVLVFIARVYAPAFDAAFVWDDHLLLETDVGYRHASFGQIMTRPFWPESPLNDAQAPYFRPIVLLSYRFDMLLGGSPREFHFTNVALHLTTCLLLGVVAVRAGASYPSALVATLTWGSLPRLTEAVAWISGRTDVLAAFFGFAALAIWPETGPPTSLDSRRQWVRSVVAGALLFLSFASKEVGLAFGLALTIVMALRGRGRASLIRTGVCLGLPIISYFGLRAAALARMESTPRALGFGPRVETVLEAVGRYAEATIDPLHPRTSIGMLGEPSTVHVVAGAFVLLGTLAGASYITRRGSIGAKLAFALAAAAIAPVLQVIPVALRGGVVADRLLYVPLAGLTLLVAVMLSNRGRWMRLVGTGFIALALVLGIATYSRTEDYRDETRFWVVAAEEAHPHNASPRMALAHWLFDSVEPEPACGLFERALVMLTERGLSSRPPHRRARERLAACWARIGRYEDSLRASRDLEREFPNSARIVLAVGFAELHVRDFDRAEVAFRRAIGLENGVVAKYVVRPGWIAHLRRDDARFDELTPHEQAEHLAALGRAREASKAHLAVATNPDFTDDERYDSTTYLMSHGDFEDTEHALESFPKPADGWDTNVEHRWHRRQRVHATVVALAPRIEALLD